MEKMATVMEKMEENWVIRLVRGISVVWSSGDKENWVILLVRGISVVWLSGDLKTASSQQINTRVNSLADLLRGEATVDADFGKFVHW